MTWMNVRNWIWVHMKVSNDSLPTGKGIGVMHKEHENEYQTTSFCLKWCVCESDELFTIGW